MQRVEDIALAWPKVLLPKDGVDHSKWAVIACDQYTSEIEYWNDVENIVGDAPSTLRLIFPEVHLESGQDFDISSLSARITTNTKTHLHSDWPGRFLGCPRWTDIMVP